MRTNYCGEVTESLIDQEVTVTGWVHRRRDHGGVIFIDLRDREGLLQVVYDPDIEDAFASAESVQSAFMRPATAPRKSYLSPKNQPGGNSAPMPYLWPR